MAPVTGLHHVVIAVSDRRAATDFYRDVVGAEVIGAGGDRIAFRIGDNRLSVRVGAGGAGTSVYFRTRTEACWSSSPTRGRRDGARSER